MSEANVSRRVIEVGRNIVGPPPARQKTVRPTKRSDYPGVPAVYLDAAERLSSPLLMGPPLCDELLALVRHLFTEEEAGVVRHLGLFRGKSARDLARAERRPLEQVQPILDGLARQKRAIASSGPAGNERYRLMPIMPGIFEMVLIGESMETLSPWHRRFAELIDALYETGYSTDYCGNVAPMVRYLPVGQAIAAHPMALPSDRLEVVLERFTCFGIGQCQCRTSAEVAGHGCGKPKGNCLVIGEWAERGIEDGWLQQVGKADALAIKAEAESHGMVSWMMNVASSKGQSSCSCCGCCCKMMRIVSEFNVPGAIAPPHFLPQLDAAKCNHCGRCARHCPMGAIVVDLLGKTHQHRKERCIGCGLCALACEQRRALDMTPVPHYKMPYRSWFSMLLHAAPGMMRNSWKTWRARQ